MTASRSAASWIVGVSLAAAAGLSSYGLAWGVPDRWNVDEQTGKSLRLLAARSPLAVVDPAHPQLYNFVLALTLGGFLAVRVAAGLPAQRLAGLSSWLDLVVRDPALAGQLTVVSRAVSVLLGLGSLLLLYGIGRRLAGRTAAAWAVACWAVSLGFVETHHMAKHTPLVLLLVLATWWACLRCVDAPSTTRWAVAWLLGGLAVTAKLDGAVALFPLFGAAWWLRRHPAVRMPAWIVWAAAAYAAGLLLGWPALFAGRWREYAGASDQILIGSVPQASPALLRQLAVRAGELVRQLGVMFSPYVGWIIIAGLVAWRRRRTIAAPWSALIALFLAAYGLVALGFYLRYEGAHTKWMIHAMPWLSLAGGAWIAQAWEAGQGRRWHRAAIVASLALAAAYTVRADTVFAAGDSRYRATRWLQARVAAETPIEYFQELDLVFGSSVLQTQDVVYYGRRSRPVLASSFAQPVDAASRQAYESQLRLNGPSSRLLVLALGSDFLGPEPAHAAPYLYEVLDGRVPAYRLAQEFSCRESFWWSPRPAYTCPVIRIYERRDETVQGAREGRGS